MVSIQVIDKSSGTYKMIRSIGSSSDETEIDKLIESAQQFISSYGGQLQFNFESLSDNQYFQSIYQNIQQVQLLGPEIILGNLFNEIGFNAVPDELFKHLVIARLVYPASKLKTIDYLQKYKGITLHVNDIYHTWISYTTIK